MDKRKAIVISVFVILSALFSLELTTRPIVSNVYFKMVYLSGSNSSKFVYVASPQKCPDMSSGMIRGNWRTRMLSAHEQAEIDKFLKSTRTEQGLPKSMQMANGKCGNITYVGLPWFRALCNPKGTTPCCYNNRCVQKSSAECKCPNCYDLRNEIHAEYSTWVPVDRRCQVKNFTTPEACRLLKGQTLVMVGDSLMRHFFTALLLVLSNNYVDGALLATTPKDIHRRCRGMYTFTEKVCRQHVKRNTTFCDGTVSVLLIEAYNIVHVKEFHTYFSSVIGRNATTFLVGVGLHDSFNYKTIYKKYMLPVLNLREQAKSHWPRIIWSTCHKFGILKTPTVSQQQNSQVKAYNNKMAELLKKHNVPVFDTFNLTSGVMSQDGTHFGIGINVMKARMFLNYLSELRNKEM